MIMSPMSVQRFKPAIQQAVACLNRGGVIAYPTEHCFGLGCDPRNPVAVRRLLSIKRRRVSQGVLLIAASVEQALVYGRLAELPKAAEIRASWPGPFTWLLPPQAAVSTLIKGRHELIAVRVTAHPLAAQLCHAYGGAIVSTSANLHGKPALLDHYSVAKQLGHRLDYIMAGPVGGADKPSTIRSGISGQVLRQ